VLRAVGASPRKKTNSPLNYPCRVEPFGLQILNSQKGDNSLEELLHHIPEILLHTLKDTVIVIPFLFLTYLFMEFLEHKSGNAAEIWLNRSGKFGPLVGSLLGVLPQCGFSAASTGLYTGRVITAGTLIAIWLSTSDEMLPILISRGAPFSLVIKVIATKVTVALIAGFLIDLVTSAIRKKRHSPETEPCIEDFCEREGCRCNEHFVVSALRHTASITLFILIFTFILNLVIHGVGEDKLSAIILDRPILGNILSATVGLIPNCAASIIITELYLDGIISIGSMLSGLLVGAGVGVAILLRNNRPLRDSLRIILLLWCIGALSGIIVDITPLGALF